MFSDYFETGSPHLAGTDVWQLSALPGCVRRSSRVFIWACPWISPWQYAQGGPTTCWPGWSPLPQRDPDDVHGDSILQPILPMCQPKLQNLPLIYWWLRMVFLSNPVLDYSCLIAVVLACFVLQTLKEPLPGLSSAPAWPVSHPCLPSHISCFVTFWKPTCQLWRVKFANDPATSHPIASFSFCRYQQWPCDSDCFPYGREQSQLLSTGRACPVLPGKPNSNEGSQLLPTHRYQGGG